MNNRHFSGYLFLTASILLSAMAQLLLKAAMTYSTPNVSALSTILSTDALFWLLGGLVCYGLSMVSWLALLAKWPLSLAYPMLSLSYVLVYVGASTWPFLHEEFSATRSIGLGIVVAGVVLVNKKPSL